MNMFQYFLRAIDDGLCIIYKKFCYLQNIASLFYISIVFAAMTCRFCFGIKFYALIDKNYENWDFQTIWNMKIILN